MRRVSLAVLLAVLALSAPVRGGEVAHATLDIVGVSLEVSKDPVVTGVDLPASVQTIFDGKTNADVPPSQGMTAVGELTGPGLDAPVTLVTQPGHAFDIPPLHAKGDYSLQNIRLVGPDGAFMQQASPSFASITVADILTTTVTVRQLTPDELRARGIIVDGRNYDVFGCGAECRVANTHTAICRSTRHRCLDEALSTATYL